MREILFRGKRLYTNSDGNEGVWVIGHLASHNLIAEYEPYGVLPYHTETAYCGFVEVDPKTVGQYTGLTDRNGKKIFEGDIIHCITRLDDGNMVVIFENGEFRMVSCENYTVCSEDRGHYSILFFEKEIIGNIYDNPELMTRK